MSFRRLRRRMPPLRASSELQRCAFATMPALIDARAAAQADAAARFAGAQLCAFAAERRIYAYCRRRADGATSPRLLMPPYCFYSSRRRYVARHLARDIAA